MIWKNPFLIKNTERQLQGEFLTLFDSTVLQMIEQRNLEIVSYVSSTPGAGKTSLFRAFLPDILSQIVDPDQHDKNWGIYNQMKRLGVVEGEKVCLVSAYLSCARSYSIIDEMFQNGRRKQIFFALLNYRVVIALLRSIGAILEIESDEFYRIRFRNIPQEMQCEEENFVNGKTFYEWACSGERKLCRYLDSERVEPLEVSFVHTTLLALKMFEPDNILIDNEQRFMFSLVIFDDFHKLSQNQKQYLSEAVYTLKTSTGIWFGQRLEGVANPQIVSMDGSLNRDYNLNIVIDNYWCEKQYVFYGMLENIADRRVNEAKLGSFQKLSDCLSEKYDEKKYEKRLIRYIEAIKAEMNASSEIQKRYRRVQAYLESEALKPLKEKALWYECIKIKENRENSGQLVLHFGDEEDVDKFASFVKENESGARFYISQKCDLPFYFGMNNLKVLSSYNVEQFLYFAAEYFECCRTKNLGSKKKKYKMLSPEEQEASLKMAVENKWNDMDFRYSNIKVIKKFLDAIGDIGRVSRDSERNSYNGGAYTGIAIDKNELVDNLNNPLYSIVMEVLGACLASKYLERREINKGQIVVFYLNRWLCVHYQLPLAYGGWKKCSMSKVLKMCSNNDRTDENQYVVEF